MSEKEKTNLSEENDPIKKMLERLRRSVTDLPPTDGGSAAFGTKDEEDRHTESGGDEPTSDFKPSREETLSFEAPSSTEEASATENASFDMLASDAPDDMTDEEESNAVLDEGTMPEELLSEFSDEDTVDESVIAQFFSPVGEEPAAAADDSNTPEKLSSSEETDEKASEEKTAFQQKNEAELSEEKIEADEKEHLLKTNDSAEGVVEDQEASAEDASTLDAFVEALSLLSTEDEPETVIPDATYLAGKTDASSAQAETLRKNLQQSIKTVAEASEEDASAASFSLPTPFDSKTEAFHSAPEEAFEIPVMHTEISDKEAEMLFTRHRDEDADMRSYERRADIRVDRDLFIEEVEATEENGYAVEVEVRGAHPRPTVRAAAPLAEQEIPPTDTQIPTDTGSVLLVGDDDDLGEEDTLHDDFLEMLAEGTATAKDLARQGDAEPIAPNVYTRRRSIRKAEEILGDAVTGEQIEMDFFAEAAGKRTASTLKKSEDVLPLVESFEESDMQEEDDENGYDVALPHEIPVTPFSMLCEEKESEADDSVTSPEEENTEGDLSLEKTKEKGKRKSRKPSSSRERLKRLREEELAAVSGIYEEGAASFNEFTSRNQISTISRRFLSELSLTILRIVMLAFLTVAFFAMESLPLFGRSASDFIPNETTLVAVHFVGVVLAVLLSYPVFVTAWRNLFCGRVTGEASLSILLLLTVAYDVLLFFSKGEPVFFGALAAGGALVAAIGDHAKTSSDFAAFRLLSSSGDKLACKITKEGTTVSERAALLDLPEGVFTRMISVKKIGFAKGFFHRITRSCEDGRSNLILLAVGAFVSLAAALIGGLLAHSFEVGMYAFLVAFSLSLPFVLLLLRKLPLFCLSRRAVAAHSAVVGEVSAIEYSDIGAMAFEDVEAFSSRNVIVQRVKTYGNSELPEVLYDVASLFSVVGGPLDGIFRSSTSDLGISEDVSLLSVEEGGICARVDGREISAGTGEYMMAKRVHLFFDPEDERILAGGKVNILFAAEEGRLIAKFYIRYKMNADFEKSIEQLYQCRIRSLIRTYDPLISEELLAKTSYTAALGVRVVRKTVEQQNDFAEPELNSGIVSRSSTRDILSTFHACRRTVRFARVAKLASYVACGAGMLGAILLSALGLVGTLPTLFLAGFEALLLAVYALCAKLYI